MNKVFNINLGGYPFTIDEDAYSFLTRYLDTIHAHFRDSEGYEEITADIEGRMAELFEQRLNNRPIVTQKDVELAIETMGTPEDFGAEAIPEEPVLKNTKRDSGIKTGKRLFRNSEDEVVGGVCSGIAAYFGINDPLWVRLGFIVLTISGGFGIPAYLLLWAIVPRAKSAADRLAMRGEDINVSNIARTVEDELNLLSEKLSDIGNDLKAKKKEQLEEIVSEAPFRRGYL